MSTTLKSRNFVNYRSIKMAAVLCSLFIATAGANASTLSLETSSSASSGTSTTHLHDILKDKKFHSDSGITDTKLKAENGSMSRYSAHFDLTYYGPRVGDLSNPYQPNPDGGIGYYGTALSGEMGFRYRLSPHTSVSLGSGLSIDTPFYKIGRFDVNTPYVYYDRFSRLDGWQLQNSAGLSAVTLREFQSKGEFGTVSYSFAAFHRLGLSRWEVGTESTLSYFAYDRPYITYHDGLAGRYNWGFYPAIKYRFNDHLGAYVSYALTIWNPRKLKNPLAIWTRIPSQRLGIDYAYNRDIYFAPYLNFYAQNFRWTSTTVNFVTVFSVL